MTELINLNKMGKIAITDEEFYLPNTKEERRTLLKQLISKHITPQWLKMPKKQADLERRLFRKLIDSI